MDVRDSLLVLTWIALALLALGLVGLSRAVNLLAKRLAEGVVSPRRITEGDRLALPDLGVPEQGVGLLAFVTKECASCHRAVDVFQAYARINSGVILTVLWRGDAPSPFVGSGPVQQGTLFDELHVGFTPFAVLTVDGIVVETAAVGSPSALGRFAASLDAWLTNPRPTKGAARAL